MSGKAVPADDPAPDWQAQWHRLNQERVFRRAAPSTLLAAWWALRAVRRARRQLRRDGVTARVAPPPAVPWGARGGVSGVLNRLEPTCIERCLVQQAWLHAFGVDREVLIGVRTDTGEFGAHAWIEDMAHPGEAASYRVIHRIAPGQPGRA